MCGHLENSCNLPWTAPGFVDLHLGSPLLALALTRAVQGAWRVGSYLNSDSSLGARKGGSGLPQVPVFAWLRCRDSQNWGNALDLRCWWVMDLGSEILQGKWVRFWANIWSRDPKETKLFFFDARFYSSTNQNPWKSFAVVKRSWKRPVQSLLISFSLSERG